MQLFLSGNPNVLEWQGVTDSITGLAIETADVQVTLLDFYGAEVAGQVWPAAMAHVSGGTYRIVLTSDVELIADRSYTAHITADIGGGLVADISVPVTAMTRES